jgi:2-polyprenyl-3-methyl-5-hydroxy-6-metoxy-1,4-benzoquinol methylase
MRCCRRLFDYLNCMAPLNHTATEQPRVGEMRSRTSPACFLCGGSGEPLHVGLSDQLFGAPGIWTLKQCARSECGLAWLDPMPLEQDIHKAYASYHTHEDFSAPRDSWLRQTYRLVKQGYLARKYGYHRVPRSKWREALGLLMYLAPSRRAFVDAQVFYLPSKKQGRLLDVGCGNGQVLSWMAALGWQSEGIDTDPVAVGVANAKGLTVHQGTLQSQQFATGSFDGVVMNHVIEHVHDPLSLMKECHRILKPGGRLIVVTPNIRSWGHRIYKRDWRGLEPPRHLQIFARPSLATLCGLAGFQSCDCRTITRAASYILRASRSLRRREGTALRQGRVSRLWAEIMALAEWAGAYLDHDAGEELALLAKK